LKIGLVALSAVAVVSSGVALIEGIQLVDLGRQREEFITQLRTRQGRELEAARHDCAAPAEHLYKIFGYSENADPKKDNSPATEEFTNHYSTRLSRCIMELSLGDIVDKSSDHPRQMITKNIFDVDERRDFGDYYWISSNTKNYFEQHPVICHMTPPDKDERYCRTNAEWENYEQEIMSS
jgi:hypothetical protein